MKTMPTTIDQLDDLSLLRIFDELSIQDLFRAGRVCVWWNAIRSKSANGRKELTLLIGLYAKQYIDEALFRVPAVNQNRDASEKNQPSEAPFQVKSFSVDFARFLYDNLPNLSTLTISCHYDDHHNSVTCLLKLFASTGLLNTLILFIDGSIDLPLMNALNSIKTLKKLNINLQFGSYMEEFDLPILGQLEEFNFHDHRFFIFQQMKNSIMHYGVKNTKLRKICIDYSTWKFDWMLSLPSEFASRFKHLHMCLDDPFDFFSDTFPDMMEAPFFRQFDKMCRHYPNLTSVELTNNTEIRPITSTELFTSLSQLHNLHSLTIDAMVMESIPLVSEILNKNIPILPSVRILMYSIKTTFKIDHDKFSNRNMHHFFPNVETVRLIRCIYYSMCKDCSLECNSKFFKMFKLDNYFQLMFCTLRIAKNFTKFQKLKSVSARFYGRYHEWSVKNIQDFAENEIDYLSNMRFMNLSKKNDKDTLDCVAITNLDSDSFRSENVVASTSNQNLDVE